MSTVIVELVKAVERLADAVERIADALEVHNRTPQGTAYVYDPVDQEMREAPE